MENPKPNSNFQSSNCVVHDDTHDWGGFVKSERAPRTSPTFSEIKSTLSALRPLSLWRYLFSFLKL